MKADLRQREPRHHDKAHLVFVRSQPCCIGKCSRPAEAAHIRMACLAIGKSSTGMAEKPSDCWTVPLCGYHHRTGLLAQHSMNEADFWSLVGINPFPIAQKLWIQSGGASRAVMPAPVKVRKIKVRKPAEKRKKIQPGRKLQSNPTIKSRGFEKRAQP